MENYCVSESCPIILNSTCVFYTGQDLLYIGVNTNDNLQTVIQKINQAIQNSGVGYAFTNGITQPILTEPVQLGGSLIKDTLIEGNFTLELSGILKASKHITTGGTSSQFVKGDGSLDNTSYQISGNYITSLTGDGIASGPGISQLTLSTVNTSPGTFGTTSLIPVITVNNKGLVTNVSNVPLSIPAQSLTFIGDVVGAGLTGTNVTLTLQNINQNVYTTRTALKFSVNAKGLITSASPITSSDIISILGYTPQPSGGVVVTQNDVNNWNAAFSWGDHALAGYLTQASLTGYATEAWVSDNFYPLNSNPAGYLTSFTETDPTVPSHVKSITTTNISNWNEAYSWGNHAVAGYQNVSEKGQANGYASLDSNGKVPLSQINDALLGNVNFQGLWNANTNSPTLVNPPASSTKGYYYIVDTAGSFASIDFEVGDWIISNGTTWDKVNNTDAVSSVFGRTGNVNAQANDYNAFYVRHDINTQGLNATQQLNARTNIGAGTGTIGGSINTGQVAFGSANNQITGDNGLFWDNVNKRLGVGNNAPIGTIHALSSTPNSQIILQNSNNAYTISSSFNFVNRFQLSQNSALPIFNIGQSDDTVTRGAIFEFFGKGFGGSNNVEGLRFLLNNPFGITGTQNIVIDSHGGGNGVIRNIELRTQNNNNQFILFTSGNACINQSTDAGFRLDVNGTTRFQGNSQITGNLLLNTTVDSGDRLRVNGTIRIDSVTNATGDVVTIDVNNVLKRRTASEVLTDISGQPLLVSGTNIKTINNESLLGSGNIEIIQSVDQYTIPIYTHTQSTNSTTWTITHNLNSTHPVITVYDNTNKVVIPKEITIINENSVTVEFFQSVSGYATIIGGSAMSLAPSLSTVQNLGNISGNVTINLSNGDIIVATLTGTTTLSFTGLPTSNKELAFTLRFAGIHQINLPSGTRFPSGTAPTPSGVLYELPCSINSSGQVIVYGSINDIRTP